MEKDNEFNESEPAESNLPQEAQSGEQTAVETSAQQHHRRKHGDHRVNWKYRMFSNHSSAGDMPRTITSI